MALKGQKFNSYLCDIKDKHNIKELSEKYNIPSGTIKTWTSKLKHYFITQIDLSQKINK